MSATITETIIFNTELVAEKNFWSEKLLAVAGVSNLIADYERPASYSSRKESLEIELSRELYQSLKSRTNDSPFLLYTALMAALKVCLYRYTGSESITVGTPALKESSRTNALAMIDDVNDRMSFRQLLLNIRQTLLDAYARQNYPFHQLTQDLKIERAENASPLFDVTLALENIHGGMPELKNDVSISFIESDNQLSGRIEFNPNLFQRETIERFKNHLLNVLRQGLEKTDTLVSEFELTTEAERQQLLSEWNETTLNTPAHYLCFHQLFETQVERTPDAVALSFEEQLFTYRELNERANQLAHHLRQLGVSTDVLVALLLNRSPEMIISVLAVLKAGGAYLPLDPAYPADRLSFMLEDAQAPLLITREALLDELPMLWMQVIDPDADQSLIDAQPRENPEVKVVLEQLAYLIYTSGSTGQPKAVMVEHRGLSNLAMAQIEAFGVDSDSRVLQFASLSFDASISEIMMALVAGATLCLESQDSLLPGPEFVHLLNERAITTVTLPPSVLSLLPEDELSALRTIAVAGEACPAEVAERWSVGRCFINAYGPTEATVCATMGEVLSGVRRKPSIGRQIDNAQVYLLDKQLRPVPIGVPGELYIGGTGVARGYLHHPELTAEKFIPHPFSTEPGARLYRAGDLARYLPSGEIEYLGRVDHQVKMHGYRIELGEIEALLDSHPAVRESMVVAREDERGDKRLVGYITSEEAQGPTTSELRNYLRQKLPLFMIPSVFVTLDRWPLTPNGKVDRHALPAPDQARPELEESFVAPATPVEELLAEIWAEALGVEKVGIHDNFFELGGDSILSIQIITRANQAGLQLKPKQIFERQTIVELAAVAGTTPAVEAEQGLVIGPAPLTPIQRWFFEHHIDNPHHYNQSLLLEVGQEFDATLLERVVQQMLVHHDALRLRFFSDAQTWQQSIAAPEAAIPFSSFDFSSLNQTAQREAIEQTATSLQQSLHLEAGPLVKVAYFNLGERGGRVLIVIHHLAVDGISWRILLEDLQRAYEQLARGEEVSLGAKTTSWKQWAERLFEHAQSEEVKAELGYWRDEARQNVTPLPVDFPEGANIVLSERRLTMSLDKEETRSLLQEVPEAYHTQINDVLLTALVRAFAGWTGQQSLLVDLEGHGREEMAEDIDLSRSVGWFTSIMPVLLDLGETSDESDALQAIKEQLREIPERGLGYGLLRYLSHEMEVRESLRSQAQAEVSFNYLGQFDRVLNDSSPFRAAKESGGATHSLQGQRSHLLEINGSIVNGQMQMTWTFSENVHRQTTVEALAQNYMQALRALISHCQSPEAGGYTPSDFPLVKLDPQELKRLVGTERHIEDIYPLAPLQQGLLFHTLYAPESGMYFTQLGYTIHKKLDVAAFVQAWQQVINRHTILRTAFMWEGLNEPLQVVRQRVELPYEQHDWTALSESEQKERLSDYLAADRQRSLNLSVAPVMRCGLIKLAEDRYQFTWRFHHLLLDGWSMSLLFKEVFAFYEAFSEGKSLQLEKAHPYSDYLAWLQRQDMSESEAFWRDALKGFSAPTSLVVDRPVAHLTEQENDREDARIKINAAQTAALQSLLGQRRLTMNTLVQGVWALLLSRYSGEDDVVFGATVSGRPATLEAVGSIVGPFINTLPVRVRLKPEASVLSWLKELQAQQVEARQYEHTPLVQVQGWSEIPRGQSLFESVLVFENYPVDDSVREAGQSLQIGDVHAVDKMNYPLALVAMPGRELLLRIAYDSQRFEADTIRRMLEHLEVLLTSIASHPGQPLSHLTLLTHAERHQLLFEFNDTSAHSPAHHLCFHQLFEQQVERTPDAIALVFADEHLTYRELNERANQLAHYLCSLGVGPDTLVAIMLERSLETVISILAIHKAGAAYLPLDPAYPADRLSFMLSDAQPAAIISRELLLDELPMLWMQVIDLDTDQPLIDSQPTENLELEVSLEQLAYLIYTSGSTGQPKGVMVAHQGLSNLASAQVKAFAVDSSSRVLQFASLSFDASIFEIVMALRAGATLCLASPQSLVGSELLSLLQEQAITNITIPPSVLSTLPTAELPELETIVVAGEACSPELVERWSAGRRFFNAYGPTEATVWSSVKECEADGARPSIGCPIENTRLYVMDERLRVAPVGVGGELYIAGAGVARGYLNRAELTAERFIPDPFSSDVGARLYRTGDVARWLPNGELEYLGRIDHQVKVRGFRIELGEIENALSRHPAVAESIVIAREEMSGEKRLVAYLVTNDEQMPNIGELRSLLAQSLPEYMIPASFVHLTEMPLTTNGKIDRRALPAPDQARPALGEAYVAPRTQTEQALCEVWSEVLGVERVGIEDNFFALGGDSIRSVQVLSKAQERGLSFTLQQLFERQSVRNLCAEINAEEVASVAISRIQPFSLITEQDREKLPENVEDAYPLTMTQAGMLFHSELNPSSAVYHSINSFRLRAPFDVQALRSAAQRLAHRHPLLRTSFDLSSYSEPLQLVHQAVEVPVEVSDWRHLSASEQEAAINEWLEEEKVRHFEWSSAPLWRFIAQRLDEESFQFTFTAHHGIIDGWSDGLFLTELFKRYLAKIKGEEESAAEEELRSSYKEYVALEREALQSEESESYWRELVSESTVLKLPRLSAFYDTNNSPRFCRVGVPISAETSANLKRLAREAGAPLKSVLLAAHLRVMSLMGGHSDVITGLVTNGRPETPDGERIIGLFLNTLPFRLSLRGGSWQELVEETFAAEKRMLLRRRYPLAQIQKMRGGEELFETAFNFTHFHVYESLDGFSEIEVLGGSTVAETNFTLMVNFNLAIASSQVQLDLDFNASELTDEQIAAIGEYYANTLAAMARDPQQRYETHSLLSSQEHQLLLEWNETEAEIPPQCLHELIEAQVERTPDAIALSFEDQHLSYRELNERANQLAHYLRSVGVSPDTLVGVLMERSTEMVVSLLAILKAGGAYLPLDPAYPQERLRFMLEDAELSVLLTQADLTEMLPQAQSHIICLDEAQDRLACQSTENLDVVVDGDNLSYVIYTSGSTGAPKAAMNTHRAIVNRLVWMQHAYQLCASDRVLQKTLFSFDVSVWEFFWPLMTGARLVIARPGGHQDSAYLADLILREQITTLHFVPSMLQVFLDEPQVERLTQLRRVICSGEALSLELQERFHARMSAELHNLYGPTEAAVDVTFWECQREGAERRSVPIGRPITNTQIYILDEQMELAPVGVAGELYIGGVGLARGYMKRAELTAERFIPDPFSALPGARLYRTGDLARYLPGGELEYLGRIDHQVKVRGFRIELGEIEAVLMQHAGVREAVVTAREERGEKRLVAYVIAKAGQEVRTVELRASLKEKLPEYMAPAFFVLLDEMPLTPNGKVDRRALPAPELAGQELRETFVSPRTPTEEVLAGVLAQVLGIEQVGVHDDFFELGGHSLLATQVISRLRQRFKQELPLRALFEAPTIAALAEMIDTGARAAQGFEAPVLRPVSREQVLPLSFAQQRLWFASQLSSGQALYSLPAAVRLKGQLGVFALEQSLSEIVRRHETLRTSFVVMDGQPTQVIASWQPLTLETEDLTSLPEAEREIEARRLAEAEARKPFDLARGPLMRASLLRLDEEDHVLLLTMHHIISDGWSMGVIVREVATLYDAFSRNLPSPLAELPIQYADFAVWQREWLQGEVLEAQLSYWTERLGGRLPALELPTDRPRPAVQSFRAATESLKIERGVAESLKALSRREGATLFMTLLAAFQVLLYRYTGQEEIVIGTDIANRNRREVEGLIGFFVNQLVLRTDLSGNPSFRELLSRVREIALGAYVNQDLPFEKLVQALQPERELDRSPLFQTKFILQNAPEKALELPGLTLDSLGVDFGTTPFDLVLSMRDEGEELSGILTYSADLFDSETIAQMIQHFQQLLESIALKPDELLSSLRLLSDEETDGYSSADFPEAEMSEKDFESLFLQLNRMSLVETEG